MTDRTMPEPGPDSNPESKPLQAGDPERLGEYEIIGRLGQGGQGAVYLGRRPQGDGDFVAIKLLHAETTEDSAARSRFIRELDVAKRVARFCTAQVLDADLAGDRPYIVSEYVPGRSLFHLVQAEGPRGGGALERLAVSTLTALIAIHQAGVVHRDFKPHNVMMGPDGPRVIDFGVARALDATGETQVVGTPAYMAPEHFTDASFGPATDMFAWGNTMVFAATGRPAFGNDEMAMVMHRILTAEPDLSALPEPLRGVVAACLDKEPARRPSARRAQEMLVGTDEPEPAAWPQHAWMVPAEVLPVAPFPEAEASRADSGQVTGEPSTGELSADTAPAPPPAEAKGKGKGKGKGGGGRTLLVAVAGGVAGALVVGGTVWAAAMKGGLFDEKAAASGVGQSTAAGAGSGGTAGAAVTPGAVTPGAQPVPGAPGQQPTGEGGGALPQNGGARPTSGPGASGPAQPGGDPGTKPGTGDAPTTTAPPKKNPYTAQQVCGSGYVVQRSSAFTGGRTYQLYSSATKKNCVVTLKTTDVGKATKVWAKLESKDGKSAYDGGAFSYYAGPVYLTAPGVCVRYSGGTPAGSTSAGWANCG